MYEYKLIEKSPCPACGRETPHSIETGKCIYCRNTPVLVNEICEALGLFNRRGNDKPVCRQAVYLKAERKKFKKEKQKPPKGKAYRVFTVDQARVLIEEDSRYSQKPLMDYKPPMDSQYYTKDTQINPESDADIANG